MQSFLFRTDPRSRDLLISDLWECGTTGIVEEGAAILRAFFEDSADLNVLLETWAAFLIERRPVADWQKAPEADYEPILIGKSFFIAPPCSRYPAPPDRSRLFVPGTSAFGSGRHESTQLVVDALEHYLKPGDMVLDIGCGSGILSQAALILGAGCVVACDTDANAVAVAREHARFSVFLGSADSIGDSVADLVLVNISAKVIEALAGDLKSITKPTGAVLLAGFVRENPPRGFVPETILEANDWQCWICRPESIWVRSAYRDPIQPYAARWW